MAFQNHCPQRFVVFITCWVADCLCGSLSLPAHTCLTECTLVIKSAQAETCYGYICFQNIITCYLKMSVASPHPPLSLPQLHLYPSFSFPLSLSLSLSLSLCVGGWGVCFAVF